MSIQTAALFDVSNCLRDGKIIAVDNPITGRIHANDYESALTMAEFLRQQDIEWLKKDSTEAREEMAELNRRRDKLRLNVDQNKAEIERLTALKFSLGD